MITPQNIAQLLKQGEGSTLELKANTPHPQNLSRLISSFANADGGVIVIGVREPDLILGTNIKRFEKILQQTKERLHGDVNLIPYSIELEGKHLGIIEIKASKVPVSSPEGYFRRIGDHDELLSAQQIVQRILAMPDHTTAITSLSETIAMQSNEISKLRESFDKANSWQRKAFYALIGAIGSALVKVALAAFGVEIG